MIDRYRHSSLMAFMALGLSGFVMVLTPTMLFAATEAEDAATPCEIDLRSRKEYFYHFPLLTRIKKKSQEILQGFAAISPKLLNDPRLDVFHRYAQTPDRILLARERLILRRDGAVIPGYFYEIHALRWMDLLAQEIEVNNLPAELKHHLDLPDETYLRDLTPIQLMMRALFDVRQDYLDRRELPPRVVSEMFNTTNAFMPQSHFLILSEQEPGRSRSGASILGAIRVLVAEEGKLLELEAKHGIIVPSPKGSTRVELGRYDLNGVHPYTRRLFHIALANFVKESVGHDNVQLVVEADAVGARVYRRYGFRDVEAFSALRDQNVFILQQTLRDFRAGLTSRPSIAARAP